MVPAHTCAGSIGSNVISAISQLANPNVGRQELPPSVETPTPITSPPARTRLALAGLIASDVIWPPTEGSSNGFQLGTDTAVAAVVVGTIHAIATTAARTAASEWARSTGFLPLAGGAGAFDVNPDRVSSVPSSRPSRARHSRVERVRAEIVIR